MKAGTRANSVPQAAIEPPCLRRGGERFERCSDDEISDQGRYKLFAARKINDITYQAAHRQEERDQPP